FFNAKKIMRMVCQNLGVAIDMPDIDEQLAKKTKKKPVGRVYSKEEISDILKACDDLGYQRFKVLFSMYVFIGMRKEEPLGLDRDSLIKTRDGYLVELWEPKNSRYREIPLP